MRQQQSPETKFERRLRAELKAIVVERGAAQAATRATVARPAWRWRAMRPGLALAAVAVAAVALIVDASDSGTPAAFAVETQPEGEVSVEIRSLEDAKGLETALGEAGVPASVNYLAAGMTCKEPRFRPAPWPEGDRSIVKGPGSGGGPIVFSVSRGAVGPDQTLVITASPSPEALLGVGVKLAEGTVEPCEPIPAPTS
jgi:hypothetical protein